MDIKVAASATVVPEAAAAAAAAAGAEKRSATCHRRSTKASGAGVKMDPAKKAKSIILNPHLWSLKRMQQSRPRGRPRKNPAPERFRKSATSPTMGKLPASTLQVFTKTKHAFKMV